MKDDFYYEVTCSAPQLAPGEYVYVRFIGESGTFKCFGNEVKHAGMAAGMDGVCRSRSKYGLPKAIEATWVSFTDRKVYKFASLLPYEKMVELFKDGGVPCVPLTGDPNEDEVTEEDEEFLHEIDAKKRVDLTKEDRKRLDKISKKREQRLERIKCFDLCFLPGGKAILYLKCPIKKILLDWSATGEEVTDDKILSKVYRTYGMTNMERYYDVFYSKEFSDFSPWRKYMHDHGSVGPVLERYLERFNYTLEVEFEDKNTTITDAWSEYTNGEDFYPTPKFNEVYKMPARATRTRIRWSAVGHFVCDLFFNEEEVLRAYDEAFGDDRTQKGELRIKVDKDNIPFELTLNVGEKSIRLEKTEIFVYNGPSDDTPIYTNCDDERTNFFVDDIEYVSLLGESEDVGTDEHFEELDEDYDDDDDLEDDDDNIFDDHDKEEDDDAKE